MRGRDGDKKRIIVDYYDGAYGPTLRIDIRAPEALAALRSVFLQLAEGRRDRIELKEIGLVELSRQVESVTLTIPPSGQTAEKNLLILGTQSHGVALLWSLPPPEWMRCVGLLDGLVPGSHQYLTNESIDDALVEVAFMEPVLGQTDRNREERGTA